MAKNNYIDNKLFLKEMIRWKHDLKVAKQAGEAKPRIPEYVGECFMLIAEKLSHKHIFLSYTFRDDMVCDAIENCVMYAHNFNTAKSKNPFAYFTQIVYYAFLRRIQREKKHLYVKYKSTEMSGVLDQFDQLESSDGMTRQFEMYENISEFIQTFENAKAAKKAKAIDKANSIKGLEKFAQE